MTHYLDLIVTFYEWHYLDLIVTFYERHYLDLIVTFYEPLLDLIVTFYERHYLDLIVTFYAFWSFYEPDVIHNCEQHNMPWLVFEPGTSGSSVQHSTTVPRGMLALSSD